MPTQKYQIHISEFCDRVYSQHQQKYGTPVGASETTTNIGAARRKYFGEPDPASNFNDEAAETAWSYRWGTQTPVSHVNSITPDVDVYEGFDAKPRPIDSLPAYLAERSGISYEDAVEYIYRAGHGCQWGGKKRVSGEVWRDISRAAGTVSAYFQDNAMRELIAWFAKEHPHETAEMRLPDLDVGGPVRVLSTQNEIDKAVWKYLASVNDRPDLTSKDIATGLGISERDSMVRKSPAWKNYLEKMKKARRVPIEAASGRPDQSSDSQTALDQLIDQENWEAVEKAQQKEERRQHVSDVPQPRAHRSRQK